MQNWRPIEQDEYDAIWNNVYTAWNFNPNKKDCKSIALPHPSSCFDISEYYGDGFSEDLFDDLHACAKSWFMKVSSGRKLYAVTWQHEGYAFYPDQQYPEDEFGEWPIPVFPNGDYSFFLTSEFKNGIFSDGLGLKIILFGKEIIEASNEIKAIILNEYC